MTTQNMMMAAEYKTSDSLTRLGAWESPTAAGIDIETTTITLNLDLRPAKWLVLTFLEVSTTQRWDSKWIDLEGLKQGDRVRVQTLAAGETWVDLVDYLNGTIKADDLSGGSVALVRAETWAVAKAGYVIPFGSVATNSPTLRLHLSGNMQASLNTFGAVTDLTTFTRYIDEGSGIVVASDGSVTITRDMVLAAGVQVTASEGAGVSLNVRMQVDRNDGDGFFALANDLHANPAAGVEAWTVTMPPQFFKAGSKLKFDLATTLVAGPRPANIWFTEL